MSSEHKRGKLPYRVMFIDHVATLSGGEIALLHLIQQFDPAAVQSIVVLGEEGPLAERLRSCAEVHVLPLRPDVRSARKDGLGIKSLKAASLTAAVFYVFQLARFIRERRVDIVHTNTLKADVLGGIAARLARTPVVWHVRDQITGDYLPPKVAGLFRMLSRWLPNLIIVNSRSTGTSLGRMPSKRVHIVYEATSVEAFDGSPSLRIGYKIPQAAVLIGLVGRISPWKGQDVFMRAAAVVRLQHPEVRFRIIGAALFGETEYEEELHQLAEELKLQDVLTFMGFRRDVVQAVMELHILVHASTKPEPFGQVIIEGMAAGKPVIATNAGGVPEIVDDGRTGLLVPMNDPKKMAEAILNLLNDKEAAHQMGLRARTHVAQNFTLTGAMTSVLEVYRRLA